MIHSTRHLWRITVITLTLLITNVTLAEETKSVASATEVAAKKTDFKNAEKFAQNGDYARAYCIYAKYAAKQDAEAEYMIGWMYHNGYGLKIDDNKAAAWWEKAAEQKYADAYFALGQLYYHGGRGLRRNYPKAVKYFIPAAADGHREAKLLLKILVAVNHPAVRKQKKAIIKTLGNQKAEALIITSKKANIRKAPSTKSAQIKRLKKGHIIAELRRDGEWLQIGIPETGQVGWVFYSLVDRAAKADLQRVVLE